MSPPTTTARVRPERSAAPCARCSTIATAAGCSRPLRWVSLPTGPSRSSARATAPSAHSRGGAAANTSLLSSRSGGRRLLQELLNGPQEQHAVLLYGDGMRALAQHLYGG